MRQLSEIAFGVSSVSRSRCSLSARIRSCSSNSFCRKRFRRPSSSRVTNCCASVHWRRWEACRRAMSCRFFDFLGWWIRCCGGFSADLLRVTFNPSSLSWRATASTSCGWNCLSGKNWQKAVEPCSIRDSSSRVSTRTRPGGTFQTKILKPLVRVLAISRHSVLSTQTRYLAPFQPSLTRRRSNESYR